MNRLSKCRRQLEEEQRETERKLRLQEKQLLALVDNAADGTMLLTSQAEIIYASPSAQRLYGPVTNSLIGHSVLSIVHEFDQYRIAHVLASLASCPGVRLTVELRCRHEDESWHWTEFTSTNLLADSGVKAIVTTCRNIDAQKESELHLTELAVTDALTGLANYRRLMEVLDSEIKRFDRTARPFAILMFDLDGLKRINDAHGHLVGSRAICRLGDILRTSCRSIDTPARFGGDEFVVVLPESNIEAARGVANRVTDRLREDKEIPLLSVSVGVAICPDHGETVEELLQEADLKLYEMKAIYSGLQRNR